MPRLCTHQEGEGSMSGDTLFPFPEPTFLFIHDVYIFPRDSLVTTFDERGKSSVRLPAMANWPAPVKGYLTAPNSSRDLSGYIQRQQIAAVCLLPLSTVVDHMDFIYCADPQLAPFMKGTYQIETARATISHIRLMCQRYRLQFESESEGAITLAAGATGTATAAGNTGALEAT
jgi:hypothetical protein